MPLLNYTTTVPVSRTIGEVHKQLVRAKAQQILTTYAEDGTASGIAFALDSGHGMRQFVLPIDVAGVYRALKREGLNARLTAPAHAERVAWRIAKDWLEAQLALINAGMAALDQVMLPYMRSGDGRTMYELYRDEQLALPAPA